MPFHPKHVVERELFLRLGRLIDMILGIVGPRYFYFWSKCVSCRYSDELNPLILTLSLLQHFDCCVITAFQHNPQHYPEVILIPNYLGLELLSQCATRFVVYGVR
jgi:hypothetical protein